ncbi:helix-turn-helix transcriptional regulator [Streptomyces albidoflavus]|nr:helix-turn-helix transcriptional regulator [Streptomyces albidoflavus]
MAIVGDIDHRLAELGMPVCEFTEALGVTPANIAVLENGRAKALRFSTPDAICRVLDCQPGDLLRRVPDDAEATRPSGRPDLSPPAPGPAAAPAGHPRRRPGPGRGGGSCGRGRSPRG